MAGPITVRWVSRPDLSVAQAAYVVATGAKCVDGKTEQRLIDSVTSINTRLISGSIDASQFWTRYRSEMVGSDDVQRGCASALLAAGCSEFQVEQTSKAIASLLSECRIEFVDRFPKLADQLTLRGRPLKDGWDTFGAGLLNEIARRIWGDQKPKRWWPARVDGMLIQPMRGGDGGIQPDAKAFWIEAMLTNVDPGVPELLRIAFLLTWLASESQPARQTPDAALSRAWQLATVPVVLAAGQELEQIRAPELPIARALELWLSVDKTVADKVVFWWQQHGEKMTALPVAVHDLARMLAAGASSSDVTDSV